MSSVKRFSIATLATSMSTLAFAEKVSVKPQISEEAQRAAIRKRAENIVPLKIVGLLNKHSKDNTTVRRFTISPLMFEALNLAQNELSVIDNSPLFVLMEKGHGKYFVHKKTAKEGAKKSRTFTCIAMLNNLKAIDYVDSATIERGEHFPMDLVKLSDEDKAQLISMMPEESRKGIIDFYECVPKSLTAEEQADLSSLKEIENEEKDAPVPTEEATQIFQDQIAAESEDEDEEEEEEEEDIEEEEA